VKVNQYRKGKIDRPKAISGEARGFKVGGLRGRVREGCRPTPPAGGPAAVPPEKFSNYTCMLASLRAIKSNFHTKINTLTPAFFPLSFGKIFKLLMHAGEF
jgi:hypothetical protein